MCLSRANLIKFTGNAISVLVHGDVFVSALVALDSVGCFTDPLPVRMEEQSAQQMVEVERYLRRARHRFLQSELAYLDFISDLVHSRGLSTHGRC